jgi:CRISPR-associated endonuclease Csn1
MIQKNYRLGLDLGTNSVGWATLALDKNNEPLKIIASGVRIFSDGREPKTGEPLAVARRIARGMRRRRDRFLSRKKTLMNYLIQINLMPKDEISRKKLELLNPYELRTKALYEELKPEELARAIFHLAQRRGFKSNRKEIKTESEIAVEDGEKKLKKENTKITDNDKREGLAKKIHESNSKTLGEFLYKQRLLENLSTRSKPDENALYATRKMYEDEFEIIKNNQQEFQKISQENWQRIYEIIFYQRPLKSQDKGFCRFLNKFKFEAKKLPDWAENLFINRDQKKYPYGLPRAYLALPSYCKFRILSEVNNLKIKNLRTREIIELTPQQKQQIIERLNSQKYQVKFSALKKLLSTKNISYVGDDFEFNLESERREGLEGNPTESLLKNEKYFGENWNNFSLQKQDEIVEFLLEEDDETNIQNKALNEWKVNEIQAKNLAKLTINSFVKTSVGAMCKEILQKLCEEISNKNCLYHQALKNLGINHSDEDYNDGSKDALTYYAEAIPASVVAVKPKLTKLKTTSTEEEQFGKIANPTVHVALNQLRKVVNSIIKDYGKPTEIHVELARNLKQNKDEKKQTEKQQKQNEKDNDEAKKTLIENNISDTYENRLRYKLWKELNSDCNDRKCIYSGETISIKKLFSSEIEIEHILPFSKTLDDSIGNKTLAHKSANNFKGNRSPFEAFGGNNGEYDYEKILLRSKNLPRHKRWRFEANAMEKFNDQNSFLASQLNDTRYLSKIARQYLSQVCKKENINVANGKLTSIIRHSWGLNSILKDENQFENKASENLLLEENSKEKPKKPHKKNRDDHRHHAIDAICIAMTDRKLLQQISRDNSRGFDLERLEIKIPNHWNSFREDTKEAIEKIIVSHKIDHSGAGKLHDETYYGVLNSPAKIGNDEYNVVSRKSFESLTIGEIEKIRDNKIRSELLEQLKGFENDKEKIKNILSNYQINGGKIKRIRVLKKEARINIIEHEQLCLREKKLGITKSLIHKKGVVGGNSHIAIWELPKRNLEFFNILKYNEKNKKYKDLVNQLSPEKRIEFLDFIENKNGIKMFERFKNFQNQNDFWVAEDFSFAITCPTNLDNARLDLIKPHPSAKQIEKLYNGDMMTLIHKGGNVIANVAKLVPSNSGIALFLHLEATKDSKKQIWLSFSGFKNSKLTKIFITPSGKIHDSGPIFKENS